jgi:hypothetical protein
MELMKGLSAVLLGAFFGILGPVLQSCGFITIPLTSTVLGGATLAIKGAELQKELSKADIRKSFESPFEKTWNMKVKVIAVEITENITEVGIWTDYDIALAELIAEKIKEEVERKDTQVHGVGSEVE